jgi:hypothetical protein
MQERIRLWLELKEVSALLLQLDLNDEEQAELLPVLQERQIIIRNQIQSVKVTDAEGLNHPEIKQIVGECLDLEKKLLEKHFNRRQELSTMLKDIKKSSDARNSYQQVYNQTEGYFIDKAR